MGNPHCVLFVADAEKAPRRRSWVPRSRPCPCFPTRTNVEFAQVLDQGRIRMRVWERGVGITLACGTGACATAVAAIRRGPHGPQGRADAGRRHPEIEWREEDGHVLMTGSRRNPLPRPRSIWTAL